MTAIHKSPKGTDPVFALDKVAVELKPQLDHYKIKVQTGRCVVIFNDTAIDVGPFASEKDCRKLLNGMIKKAKDAEFKRNQTKLFDGVEE